MKRVATGVVLLALIAAGVVAVSVGAASSSPSGAAAQRRRPRSRSGSVGAPATSSGVQEGRGRVRPEAPGRRREGRRRDQRRQDLRRAPLGQRPGHRQLVHVVERRDLLPVRRLDRPRPAPQARPHRRQPVPGDVALLHAVQGQTLRSAAACGRNRALLQHDALQEGRPHRPAEDAVATRHLREEADGQEQGRVDQDTRLRPEHEFLPRGLRQRRLRLPAAHRRELLRQEREVEPRHRSRRGRKLLRWQKRLSTTSATTSSSAGRPAQATSSHRPIPSRPGSWP